MPTDNVFKCESCGYTAVTANGAAQHELSRHGGAQTMWTSQDREEATK